MVYVASDGTVRESRPWDIGRISDCFWGLIDFVVAFFRTLIPGGGNAGGGSGTRGRDGPGGPGGGGPGGPRRRMGGITTIQDCSMPGGGG